MKRFVKAVSDGLSKPSLPLRPGVPRSYIASDEEDARYNPPPARSAPATVAPTGAGIWIKAEVERMRAAGALVGIRRKSELAQQLARRMHKAAGKDGFVGLPDSDKSVRWIRADHIANSLEEWGCWPL